MRTTFPTVVEAVYMGIDRQAGEFTERGTGEVISFGRNHLFAFESADGTTQTLAVSERDLDNCKGFKMDSVKKFESVALHGEVVLNSDRERPSFFRLLSAEAGSAVNAA